MFSQYLANTSTVQRERQAVTFFLILILVSGIYQFMSDYLTWGKYIELVQVGNSFRLLEATLYNEAFLLAIEGTIHILLMV